MKYQAVEYAHLITVVDTTWSTQEADRELSGVVWYKYLTSDSVTERSEYLAEAGEVARLLNVKKPPSNRLHPFLSNLYGCLPCPNCGNRFRRVYGGKIVCGRCNFEEWAEGSAGAKAAVREKARKEVDYSRWS